MFVGAQTQHGGTINGFTAGFWRMPEQDRVVIVLDNGMSHEVPALTAALAAVLYGGRPSRRLSSR